MYRRRAEPGLANREPYFQPPASSESSPFPRHPHHTLTSCLRCDVIVLLLGHALISRLLQMEPAPLAATLEGSSNESGLLSLCELLNRQLLLLIGWAKQVPGEASPALPPIQAGLLSDGCSAPPPQASQTSHWSTRCLCCRAAGWKRCWWAWPGAPRAAEGRSLCLRRTCG